MLTRLKELIVYRNLATYEETEEINTIDGLVEFLIPFVNHDDKQVRIYLCQILHAIPDHILANRMKLILLRDADRDVSFWATMAFDYEASRVSNWDLIETVRDIGLIPHVRLHALQLVRVVGKLTTTKYFLESFLYGDDLLIQGYAADYLGFWGYHEYIPQLLRLFDSDIPRSKGGAILALRHLRYKNWWYLRKLYKLVDDSTIICEYGGFGEQTIGNAAFYTLHPIQELTRQPNNKRWYKNWLKKHSPQYYKSLNS